MQRLSIAAGVMTSQLLNIAVTIILVAAIAAALKRTGLLSRRATPNVPLPYRKKDYLLSKAERSFYEVVRTAVGNEWTIFAKVRLLDLVWLPRGTKNSQAHRNRVQSKHVDFVLCDPRTLGPVLVIEFDDRSHERTDRQDRDAFVDAVLRAAGLPVLHVPASSGYVTADLSRRIREAMASQPNSTV